MFRPCEQNFWEMLTNSSWRLLFGLFARSACSLLEWNIETQSSEIAFSDPVPDIGITNHAASLAPATPGATSEFALIPSGGNVVSSDELVAQASSGCGSNTKRLPRKMRARDEMMCPIDGFQLNDGEENVRQLLPIVPNAQQGGGGQNSGGNGEPQRRLLFAPKDDANSYFFVPKRNRPKQNSEICPEPMHSVPVCGRPSDASALMDADNSHLTIEPCYPCKFLSSIIPWAFFFFSLLFPVDRSPLFSTWEMKYWCWKWVLNFYADVPFVGCVPNTIGYCCFMADVAYASVSIFFFLSSEKERKKEKKKDTPSPKKKN